MSIVLRVERVLNGQESDLWFLMPSQGQLAFYLLRMTNKRFMVYPTGDIIDETTEQRVTDPTEIALIMSGATGVPQIPGMMPFITPYNIQNGPVSLFTLNLTV